MDNDIIDSAISEVMAKDIDKLLDVIINFLNKSEYINGEMTINNIKVSEIQQFLLFVNGWIFSQLIDKKGNIKTIGVDLFNQAKIDKIPSKQIRDIITEIVTRKKKYYLKKLLEDVKNG